MKFHALLRALILLLLLPSLARGQTPAPQLIPPLTLEYIPPPLVPVPPGDDVIVPLKKGDPAPFTGQLMDPATALRWLNYLEQSKLRLREDVLLERRTCNANMAYYDRRVSLEYSARLDIEKDLRDRLLRSDQRNVDMQKQLLEPGIFKSPIFWFFTGVVTSGIILGVSAYSLGQVR